MSKQEEASLILKLYDLRREPVMREARASMVTFSPKSFDDVLALVNAFGTKEQAYFRQVAGYWEMAASLVNRGALNRVPELANVPSPGVRPELPESGFGER